MTAVSAKSVRIGLSVKSVLNEESDPSVKTGSTRLQGQSVLKDPSVLKDLSVKIDQTAVSVEVVALGVTVSSVSVATMKIGHLKIGTGMPPVNSTMVVLNFLRRMQHHKISQCKGHINPLTRSHRMSSRRHNSPPACHRSSLHLFVTLWQKPYQRLRLWMITALQPRSHVAVGELRLKWPPLQLVMTTIKAERNGGVPQQQCKNMLQ
jgi:hypothetical protein